MEKKFDWPTRTSPVDLPWLRFCWQDASQREIGTGCLLEGGWCWWRAAGHSVQADPAPPLKQDTILHTLHTLRLTER
jgi:hypothetical protein